MSGLHEVDCNGCGRRHVTNGEQARKERVLRCDCGQFVRLDRALPEQRSAPTPPPPSEHANDSVHASPDEDDATHMLGSLAAVAALNVRGRSRSPQPSLVDDERVSRPVPRADVPRTPPSSPAPARQRQPSIAPSDKPLWYVDLGGTELVEMTIEQLILARRSGKLGEGALVWREGMPSWRPVGTLIPAASAHPGPIASASAHPSPIASANAAPAASRPSAPVPAPTRTPLPATGTPLPAPRTPPPPARTAPPPTRTPLPSFSKRTPPPPSLAEDPTPKSLGSYERPLATLEFALERPKAAAFNASARSPLPSMDSSAAKLSRPPTPLPRAGLSSPSGSPFPRAAALPSLGSLATPAPLPRRSPPPPAPSPVAVPAPPPAAPAASDSDGLNQPALAFQAVDAVRERPRWVSACIALVVCVTASAAGASLVRSLKQQRHPLAASAVPAVANTAVASQPSAAPPPAVSSAPLVVDLESLSVERKPAPPRVVRAAPKPTPTEPSDSSEQTTAPANDSAAESVAPEAPEAPKSSDLPAAARSNPYGNGSLIDQIKKATADEEGGQ